jgi:putative intracellular protease/amidase
MSEILFVVTSHTQLGDTNQSTGFHFSEMGEPYAFLKDQGHNIDFVSPQGGAVRADGYDGSDPLQRSLMQDKELQNKLARTMAPAEVDTGRYDAIYFVGGHGTMWDFPDNMVLANITREMYENNKVVAAVCHGPAGIANVRLSNGNYLVTGKRVAAFSDDEERAIKLDKIVPFLLESKLIEHGAHYTKAPLWGENVEVDGHLVTGQNPASALGVGQAIHKLLNKSASD